MKRMSTIAKELRAQGRMFSQTTLQNDLSTFDPVFKEGKVIFYADHVTDALMGKYKVRKQPSVLKIHDDYYEDSRDNWDDFINVVQEPDPRLIRIERMLAEICQQLGVAVEAA